jgi:hypothetical protein
VKITKIYGHANTWAVVTVKEPVIFSRSDHETWLLNPGVRYLIAAYLLDELEAYLDTISDLRGCAKYRPLHASANLADRKILISRTYDRGIGDILFMTGPMAYFHAVTASTVKLDFYALADRAQVLLNNPLLRFKSALSGPIIYDAFDNYDYHWLVGVATEYDHERDQLNVYDCLYQQLGVDHRLIDPKYKRPTAALNDSDKLNFDAFCHHVYLGRNQLDLRKTPYYVVAPLANATLRLAPYSFWLKLVVKLAERRPVLVLGNLNARVPDAGMTAGEFISALDSLSAENSNIISLMSARSPLRATMAIVANALLAVTLDSGLLYVAQAFRTPAISIWGPISPGARLYYDPDYMDLAVWLDKACAHAPCYAHLKFPVDWCPRRDQQKLCEVLLDEDQLLAETLSKVDKVEGKRPKPLVKLS